MKTKNVQYFSKSRVEAFSDGIFAVIITLLVLEIHVTGGSDPKSVALLWKALIAISPKILSWIVSFLIVCVIWVNHHRIFEQLKTVTHRIFWLNANLLLWCSLIPFPTALMGDYINNPLSLIAFGLILALMALAFSILRLHILKNSFVLNEGINLDLYRKATTKSLIFGPVLYLLGAACSLIHTYLALAIYFIIPVYFIFYNTSGSEESQV